MLITTERSFQLRNRHAETPVCLIANELPRFLRALHTDDTQNNNIASSASLYERDNID